MVNPNKFKAILLNKNKSTHVKKQWISQMRKLNLSLQLTFTNKNRRKIEF